LSHCLLSEFRHRYNHKMFEGELLFLKIGHFNTWLM
jgi:hypothetical protein